MFLDMTAVMRYVNVTAAQDHAGLQEDAATACQWVEDEAGPIEQRTVTERAWSTGAYLRLMETPAAVTSIDGSTDLPTDLALVAGGAVGSIAAGWHVVVYTVGSETPPTWAVGAAMARTKQLWQIRLGGKANSGIDYGARAEGLLRAHRRGPRP